MVKHRSTISPGGAPPHAPASLFVLVLILAFCGPTRGSELVNEIHYHPASNDDREEFVELYNGTSTPIDLSGATFTDGIQYSFPAGTILSANSYLVIAAHPIHFTTIHPQVPSNVILGPWSGRLSDRGETIRLRNAQNETLDRVSYANEGEFSRRTWSTDFRRVRGIQWTAAHAGGGFSLERRQPNLSNNVGANWEASERVNGSPGVPNSQATTNSEPFITNVRHFPPMPRSNQPVRVTVEIHDEALPSTTAQLFYSVNEGPFQSLDIHSLHRDEPSKGIYQATIPPQTDHSVIEFYIQAQDAAGHQATWPRPTLPNGDQDANALYQVDDRPRSTQAPEYRIIMRPSERQRFLEVVQPRITNSNGQRVLNDQIYSDGRFHATFISHHDGQYRVRYHTEIRNRGNGSRQRSPNNFRVDFASDRLWRQAEKLNLNSQFPWLQTLGASLSRQIGLLAAPSRLVRVYLNDTLRAPNSYATYEMYAANDVMNSDFAARQGLGNANIYRGIRRSGTEEADLQYLGEDPAPYRRVYFKESNKKIDDWTDLIGLTQALSESPDERFETEVDRWIDIHQWMRYFASETFYANQETALGNGFGDDYYMYRSEADGRFRLIPYDQDTILGQGDTAADPKEQIWKANRGPVTKRLLTWPNFAPIYYSNLVQLAEGPLSAAELKPILKRVLEPSNVPETRKDQLLTFAINRADFLLNTIPRRLETHINLPEANGVYIADSATASLRVITGLSDATRTTRITVNGTDGNWDPVTARWLIIPPPLADGINRFEIKAWDATNQLIETLRIDVYLPPENYTQPSNGEIAQSTQWKESGSPILIERPITIRSGAELTIEPGVHIEFTSQGRLNVEGTLHAIGEPHRPITLTAKRPNFWGGIHLSPQSTLDIRHVVIEGTGTDAITMDQATLTASDTTWRNFPGRAINANTSTVHLNQCRFQDVHHERIILIQNGNAMGSSIIENCRFEGNNSNQALVEVLDSSNQSSPIILRHNRFISVTGTSLLLNNIASALIGNRFIGRGSAESAWPIGLEISNDNPASPLPIDLARNVFHQTSQAIASTGSFALRSHNNTFDDIQSHVLSISNGTIDAEWFNNLYRSVEVGYHIANPTMGSITLNMRDNLGDAPHNLTSSHVPSRTLGLGAEATNWTLSPGATPIGAGFGGSDIGATVNGSPHLNHLPAIPWPLSGRAIPLWAPGVTQFQITEITSGSEPIHPITLPNNGNWKPQSNESGARMFRVESWYLGDHIGSVQEITLMFDDSAPLVSLSEVRTGAFPNQTPTSNWIEVENLIDRTVSLSGYALTDDPQELRKYVFPFGTQLGANERLVLQGSDSPGAEQTLPFRLSPRGETIVLSNPQSEIIDSIQYGRQIPESSIARSQQGPWRLADPTPNAVNQRRLTASPTEARISEYLTQPAPASRLGEFIEIENNSPLPLSLEQIHLSNEPENNPTKFSFPALSFLDGYEHLLLAEHPQSPSHHWPLPFALSSQPAALGLTTTNGQRVDRISYRVQRTGISESIFGLHDILSTPFSTPGFPNEIKPSEQPPITISLISPDHTWRFDQSGQDLGSAWRAIDFDDDEWDQGQGIHSAGKALLPEEPQTDLKLGIVTYYFRTRFQFKGLIQPREAWLHLLVDDGAVVYLNNREIARLRIPSFPPLNAQTPGINVDESKREGPLPIDPQLILPGENIIAVEVHQSSPTSEDVAFSLSLEARLDAGNIEDVVLSEALADSRLDLPAAGTEGTDWVEIYNRSILPVDLSHARLTDNLSRENPWSFGPSSYIAGLERKVIHFNPNEPRTPENTGFGLKASGDGLFLLADQDGESRIVDAIRFGLQAPNISLSRLGNDQQWGPAKPTPGLENQSVTVGNPAELRLNEWMARSSQGPDWFELYNPSPNLIDLSGLLLSDDLFSPAKHSIAEHSFIGAHSWRQFFADNTPERGPHHVGFKLSGGGESLVLATRTGDLIDTITFGPQEADQSEGRQPDGSPTITRFSQASPGASNNRDRDQDGMDDQWEQLHGLDPTQTADAIDDPDADGLSNLEEFLLGTDPRSAQSALAITSVGYEEGQIVISFSAIEDRAYAIQQRVDLQTDAWETVWVLDSAAQSGEVRAQIATNTDQAFYRLILR